MRINRLLKRELRAKNLRYDGPLRPADDGEAPPGAGQAAHQQTGT